MAPPRRKPSPAFARAHAAAASRARRQHTRRRGSVSTSPESGRAQPTAHSCRSIPGPLLQRRKHPEQGGCGDAGCSLWKLACTRCQIPSVSDQIASHLQKGAAGMQLVEAGLRAIQHPATSAQQYRKPPAKGGSAGKQLVEAGLRAIGLSVQQILCILHFRHASAFAAISTAMRAARDRLRARTARRARHRTRCTCAHEPRYNSNFKLNI